MSSPLAIYNAKITDGSITKDALQSDAIGAFEELFQSLNKPKSFWSLKPQDKFYGLYIYGSVGRGKTFLMDLFVDCIPKEKITRQHFHNFMLWFHQQLRGIKKQQNPIDLVIKKLASKTSILCLDEFLVHDITDAMILSKILLALKKYNISLITTSNVNPINLYEGGLQRKKFIPAIEWMSENMKILQLDGNYDYRTHKISTKKKWFNPINSENQDDFEHIFSEHTTNEELFFSDITINKRKLKVIKRSCNHIVFNFETLCQDARNAYDFIQLTRKYKSLFIVMNKGIEIEDRNTARRFITLIDVMYDANTPIYVLSVVDIKNIYLGDELSFEMQRTVSRLMDS